MYTISTAPHPGGNSAREDVPRFARRFPGRHRGNAQRSRARNSARLPVAAPPQAVPKTMPVHGVAYDSIRREPLRDAFVSILGSQSGARNTTTDSHGRFQFDSVAPGDYTFAIQHAVLDSLGLTGISRKATVVSEGDEIRLGVPSFGTLWRIECAGLHVPKDSGFVFGTIRDATTMRPLAHAHIQISWTEFEAKGGRVRGRIWRAEGVADDSGNYSVCDVPTWEEMSIRAGGARATGFRGERRHRSRPASRTDRTARSPGRPDRLHVVARRGGERHRQQDGRLAVRRGARRHPGHARGPDGPRRPFRAAPRSARHAADRRPLRWSGADLDDGRRRSQRHDADRGAIRAADRAQRHANRGDAGRPRDGPGVRRPAPRRKRLRARLDVDCAVSGLHQRVQRHPGHSHAAALRQRVVDDDERPGSRLPADDSARRSRGVGERAVRPAIARSRRDRGLRASADGSRAALAAGRAPECGMVVVWTKYTFRNR